MTNGMPTSAVMGVDTLVDFSVTYTPCFTGIDYPPLSSGQLSEQLVVLLVQPVTGSFDFYSCFREMLTVYDEIADNWPALRMGRKLLAGIVARALEYSAALYDAAN